ncbi:HAMP domain-containing methyl-accepting chemotaxis protein [uncultured Roseibium sp.]|uniref:methyl-accepting chemotaxis protein n=1 Tax=uncultured Roseibium sp. TaxID=1936171 RepID=UPI003217CE59
MPSLKFFRDLSIAMRVGCLSAIAILAIGVLAGVFYYGQVAVERSSTNYAQYSQLELLAVKVQAGAAEMRQREKDFLLYQDLKFVDLYTAAEQGVTEALDTLAKLPSARDVAENVRRLDTAVEEHQAQFNKVVEAYRTIGLTEEDGLKGQLRAAVHAVEEKLAEADLDPLTVKMLMMRRHEKDFMLRGGNKYIGRINERRSEFDPLLAQSDLPADEKAEIGKLMDAYVAGVKAYAAIIVETRGNVERLDQIFTERIPDLAAILKAAALGKTTAGDELETTQSDSRLLFNVSSVTALILALGLAWLIGRSITRPIGKLTDTMERLAGGDLDLEVANVESRNEIGGMARAVQVFRENAVRTRELEQAQVAQEEKARAEKRAMMDKLADDFQQSVGTIVDGLSAASTDLNSTASSMTEVAQTTSDRAGNVAAASEQTAANVQTVASAAVEMTTSINEISQQVLRASQASKQASSDVKATASQITNLSQMADQIGEVISMISDIADQTNLLALNATIESARVGEAGKGFAVVASEVKALAAETAKATEGISELITAIQSETQGAVAAIDKVGSVIADLEETSASIAAAMEEQDATTQEVARNVSEAASGTQEVSRSIAGVNEASANARSASDDMMTSAQKLAKQSEAMKAQVQEFLTHIRAA